MPTVTVKQAFALAVEHHQAGRLAEAEALYRQILTAQPNHAEALRLLGVIAHQAGRHELAVEWIRQAIALDPNNATAHCNLGEVHQTASRPDEAVAAFHRAVELQPDYPEAYLRLGVTLKKQGRLDEAIAAYRRALKLQPHLSDAYNNLGNALSERGQVDEAIAAYHQALQIDPDFADAHGNLGNALTQQDRLEEAMAAYGRALELNPDSVEAHYNVGVTLRKQGRLDEAAACNERCVALDPRFAKGHLNMGVVWWLKGRFHEAETSFRQAIAGQPNLAEAHMNLGILLLLFSRYEDGWREYEWRRQTPLCQQYHRNFSVPMWDGKPAEGKTILICAEQGYGDTLQFARYLPLVRERSRAARIILECQPGLKTLLAGIEDIPEVLEYDEPLPAFDLYCPLMSLPLVFGTGAETIPAAIPYLRIDAIKSARWWKRLDRQTGLTDKRKSSQCGSLKVGLVWAGGLRPHQPDADQIDRRRSMRLSQFGSLARVPDVVFVSLQKGSPATQAQTPPRGMTLLDWTDELHDFSDTAALIEALDLVITVDTAVAHLAGALGKPIWMLNRFDTCWRWGPEGENTPWYPSMRLFRQSAAGDWEGVVERVAAALRDQNQIAKS